MRWEVPDWSRRRGLVGPVPESVDANAVAILVIGHDQGRWSPVADTLRVAGYTVIQASAGTDARRMVRHMHFDVIVLDASVPDLEVESLLATQPNPTPVIQVSVLAAQDGIEGRRARPESAPVQTSVAASELVGAVAGALRRDGP
jgi:DNA-binding response OmpR family regulator